ncbi:MAG: hypothetical protein H7835_19710 [Magnetococcus sp. XQGC-1]
MEAHGLDKTEFSLSPQGLVEIIRYYTREAGVRNLDREIASLCRKTARALLSGKATGRVVVTSKALEKYLGVRRHRFGLAEDTDLIGVTTGLAWTEVGGEILTIEGTQMDGKGKLLITGKLGDVMQESAQAAMTYVRSRSKEWGLVEDEFFQKRDIHIHVPEGATPKDGPSAGIAMCVTLVSALLGIPVRRDVAMTGEITLRGRVLVIGGLKEKLLAAHRAGVKHVLVPSENVKDLKEVPQSILKDLEVHPVNHMDEVLRFALTKPLQSLPAEEKIQVEAPILAEHDALLPAVDSPAVTH